MDTRSLWYMDLENATGNFMAQSGMMKYIYFEWKKKYESEYPQPKCINNYDEMMRLIKEYRNTESARKYKREYESNRKKNDINHKIACNLRSRLYQALIKNQKVGSAVDDLGCSIKELKKHLESKFAKGMSWDNYGEWHIDHIKPLANYDLTNRTIFLELCNYKNLQPLWLKDNISKSNKEN